MTSPVYFWNLRASLKAPYQERIRRLLDRTRFAEAVDGGELTAVKLHFGERGVTSHVQPLMIKPIIDFLLKAGAKPFLTDASTLYVGQRGEAVSHSMQAAQHGFDPLLLGAPVIIADGLKGASQEALRVKGGKHIKKAFIAADIAGADLLVSINHAKGHELAGFGGALKNIGMGSASKQGKMQQHVTTGPLVVVDKCAGCGACIAMCASKALSLTESPAAKGKKILLDNNRCIGCGACFLACKHGGLEINWQTDVTAFLERMMEYAAAVLQPRAKPCLHINFVTCVTPDCDCMGFSDACICPDVGILASLDPVAIDQASIDLINKAEPLWPSHLPKGLKAGDDKLHALRPHLPPAFGLDYAEALGLGTRKYELVAL
ncbi:MAG: DUF362 domain-containing protein [Desulfovibrio sp.]|jgi:hypothetical protein|nr:DUF362 domain-containing protein [Desulfovibrio sp.]